MVEGDDSDDTPEKTKRFTIEDLHKLFPLGMMMWGKLPGYNWWPGSVISYDEGGGVGGERGGERGGEPQVWIKWYGDNQLSQVRNFLCSCSWSRSQTEGLGMRLTVPTLLAACCCRQVNLESMFHQ